MEKRKKGIVDIKKEKNNLKPIRLAITMGDPAGIGPEIILKIYNEKSFPENCIPVVVGYIDIFEFYCNLLKIPLEIKRINVDEIDGCRELIKNGVVPIIQPNEEEIPELKKLIH